MAATSTTTGTAGHPDNRLLAATLCCSAIFCASTQDSLMKYLSGGYPIHELLTIRSLVAVPILLVITATTTGFSSIPTPPRHLWLVLLRGALLYVGFMSFALAFAAIPLADVVTVYFTMPFIVAGLSAPLLGERVGLARWMAIAAGFLGVFVMLQEDAHLANPMSLLAGFAKPGALLAFLSATCYAVGQMMSRSVGRHVPPVVMSFYQNLIYLFVSLGIAIFVTLFPFDGVADKSLAFLVRTWIVPPAADVPVIVAIAILGSFALPLFSTAYRYGEASFVASFEYTAMFWAVLYGVLLFGEVPGLLTWAGASVVVAAGLFMLAADRRRASEAGATA